MEPSDVVLIVLRVWIAAVMLAHGIRHARTLEGTTGWFASLGFRRADLQARLSAVGEIAIGLGIGVGLLTSLAVAGLVTTVSVAFWTVHRKAGFFVFARPDEGWEYVGTLGMAAVTVAVIGPGEASIDHAIGLDLTGWVGAAIALSGVVLAAGQLALFWSAPVED